MDIALQFAIEALIARAAHLIDDDRLEDWPALFVEDGVYRVTTAENFESGLPLAIISADSRAMLRDRVSALRHANIFEAQRYRHATSCTVVEHVEAGVATVVTNFIVVRTMQSGEQIVFATGRYLDRIRMEGEGGRPQFEDRTVVLDSRAVDTLLAIPL
jgi:3-phenylpropionate/cinnamic acid dioxygenase small subunit